MYFVEGWLLLPGFFYFTSQSFPKFSTNAFHFTAGPSQSSHARRDGPSRSCILLASGGYAWSELLGSICECIKGGTLKFIGFFVNHISVLLGSPLLTSTYGYKREKEQIVQCHVFNFSRMPSMLETQVMNLIKVRLICKEFARRRSNVTYPT